MQGSTFGGTFRSLAGIALAAAMCTSVRGAELTPPAAPVLQDRPKVALVLGGGGAKGAAHIGVLKVLDELHVPVDCVAGTSMGALVGATLAAGVPPDDIERLVRGIDWGSTVGSEGRRARAPIRRKREGVLYTNNLEFGLKNGKFTVPGGFLVTQGIEDVLRNLVAGARATRDFDDLPLPFRAVATDMLAGEMVVLGEGDLTVAMRASMAVPGAFSPVVFDGRVLADGGQLRNLPVDVGRELCGDVVIAVSLAAPKATAADLASALSLASRSMEVMIEANSNAQLATLTEEDVSIVVQMGDIGSADFERVPDAIPLGREAARAKAAELSRYAVSPEAYAEWRQRITRDINRPFVPSSVAITGLQKVNPEYVRSRLSSTTSGEPVTSEDIARDSERIFALGDFQKVEHRLVGPPSEPAVEFLVEEKAWGPDYVRFDLGLGFSAGGDFSFALLGEYDRTWLNRYGAEWSNSIQIGQDLMGQSAFYQPLDFRQRFFVEPVFRIERQLEDIYDDGERIAEYVLMEGYGQLDAGLNIGSRAQLRVGYRQGWGEADLETGPPGVFPESDSTRESSVVLSAIYDTRDAVGLPTRGSLLSAQYMASGTGLGGDQRYDMLEGVALKVLPFFWGDTLYVFGSGGAELDGDLPPYRLFRIGGVRSFPGLERHQLRGESYWLGGVNYNWKLADLQSLFGQALYGGVRLTAGEVSDRVDDIDEGVIYGIAGNLSGRTPFGPFLLSLGYADNDSWQLQMSFGRPIREGSVLDQIW